MTVNQRRVNQIIEAVRTVEGGGFIVQRPFPTRVLDHFDPFLLLDEAGPINHSPGEALGAPDHPHRGFETFTYILEGELDGWDSTGFRDTFGPGDIEWTTAGRGIIHGGGPSANVIQNGGLTHIFQLWVNLAQAKKMIPPQTKRVKTETIPVVSIDNNSVKVIAGSAFGATGPIQTTTPIQYLHVKLAANGSLEIPIPHDHNAMIYVFNGELDIPSSRPVQKGQLGLLTNEGDSVEALASISGAEFLVISGTPLNEPIARKGPFVMNTHDEVYQAYLDYGAGKFRD